MKQLPRAVGWTDHNSSDPGITTLELVAYSVAALTGVALIAAWRRRTRCARQAD